MAPSIAVGAAVGVGAFLGGRRRLGGGRRGRGQHDQNEGGEGGAHRRDEQRLRVLGHEDCGEDRAEHEGEADGHAELTDGTGAVGVGATDLIDCTAHGTGGKRWPLRARERKTRASGSDG